MFLIREVTTNQQKRFTVCKEIEEYTKTVDQKKHNIEILPEFAAFMLEIIPKNPFHQFLNAREIYEHFSNIQKAL